MIADTIAICPVCRDPVAVPFDLFRFGGTAVHLECAQGLRAPKAAEQPDPPRDWHGAERWPAAPKEGD